MVETVEAETILHLSEVEAWHLYNRTDAIKVIFKDGEVDTTARRYLFAWYLWKFHRLYPETPLKKEHHFDANGITPLSSKHWLGVMGKIRMETLYAYPNFDICDHSENLMHLVYSVQNDVFNMHVKKLPRYRSSINIFSFQELFEYPPIKAANDACKANPYDLESTIEATYAKIENILMTDPVIKNNELARAVRLGLVRVGQVLQCISARGKVTDIDQMIFRNPITTGFYEGMRTIEDQGKESRSCGKALWYSKDPVADAEYFNRQIQLLAATLKNLHYVDCGSTGTIPFHVGFKSDLKKLLGKSYKADDGWKIINGSEIHLVNKVIDMRSISKCVHPDPQGVCMGCYGTLALNVPRGTNIGHFSTTAVESKLTQGILSVKHDDSNSTVSSLPLSEFDQKYLLLCDDPNYIRMNPKLIKKNLSLIIKAHEAVGFNDIGVVKDVSILVLDRISEITVADFIHTNDGLERAASICTNTESRNASLTYEALQYIKRYGYTVTAKGDYKIELDHWNNDQPLFYIPMKHFSMVDLMRRLERVVKGSVASAAESKRNGQMKRVVDCENFGEALVLVHELLHEKISYNIAQIEALIMTVMIESSADRDFNLPSAGNDGEFTTFNAVMANRSLSAVMAHEEQQRIFYEPSSYLITDRPPHPADDFIATLPQ